MAFITLFAFISSIADIVHGGREIQAGWACVYALIAALGCIAIATIQWKLAKKTKSPLLEVDTKNWLVDGALSIAVAVAFLIAILLTGTRFAYLLPYADPGVVIVLVLLSSPIPAMIIRDNWNQLLGRAPDQMHQEKAREAIASALSPASAASTNIRMQQIGRFTYVQVYVLRDSEIDGGIEGLDRCRDQIAKALEGEFDNLALDVVFTRDRRWIAASVGNSKTPAPDLQVSTLTNSTVSDARDASEGNEKDTSPNDDPSDA